MDVSVDRKTLIVQPFRPASYLLAELLDGITDANLHGEIWTASPWAERSGRRPMFLTEETLCGFPSIPARDGSNPVDGGQL